MKLVTQSTTILSSTLLVLVIVSTQLVAYMVPILGFLIVISVIFIIIRQRTKKGEELFIGSNKEVFVITATLLLAVFLTGGLNSNLFFLLYFLLFGIVFLFEPPTVFVLLLGLVVVFFPSLNEGDLVTNIIKLGSLAFLSPISYFFGREFQKRETLEKEVEDMTGQIIEDTQTLKQHTKNPEAIDELEDIEEQARKLQEEAEKDN